MSRFTTPCKNTDGTDNGKAVYGFDRPLAYYFVDHVHPDGDFEHLVGLCSNVYGSALNCLECLERLGAEIPEQHREELLMDLPLSEVPHPDNCHGGCR